LPACDDERLKRLCEKASLEQDPNRLMELVQEINRILGEDDPREATNEVPSVTPSGADAA
jgi:hypothetical protein